MTGKRARAARMLAPISSPTPKSPETTNTEPNNDAVLFAFATTPAAPAWLSLGTKTEMSPPYGTIENQAELIGSVPNNLTVDTDYTFKIRAYEEGATPMTATTAQYNDKTFIYTVRENPACVSPSEYDCPA